MHLSWPRSDSREVNSSCLSLPAAALSLPARSGVASLDDRCPWICLPQAAKLVGKSERSLYRAKELGELPGVSISGGEYWVATTRLLRLYGLSVGDRPNPETEIR